MNTNAPQLGIYVSKLKLDVALLLPTGAHAATFVNTPKGFLALARWLARFPVQPRVCLEATGTYALPVAHYLHGQGLMVSIVNPMGIHFFARTRMSRNKTDAHDATLIAHFGQQHQPRAWQPPTPVQAQIRLLDRQLRAVAGQIEQVLQAHPTLKESAALLTTIPGVGTVTAATVLAIMPEIDQLDNARQLAAFAGVTPSQRQSGTLSGRTRMSKLGHRRLRKALYFPAITALRCNPRVQALAIRLAQKGKAKMVIVGAAMRLLAHLIFGVLKNRTAFDPTYQQRRAGTTSSRAAASLQLAPGCP